MMEIFKVIYMYGSVCKKTKSVRVKIKKRGSRRVGRHSMQTERDRGSERQRERRGNNERKIERESFLLINLVQRQLAGSMERLLSHANSQFRLPVLL